MAATEAPIQTQDKVLVVFVEAKPAEETKQSPWTEGNLTNIMELAQAMYPWIDSTIAFRMFLEYLDQGNQEVAVQYTDLSSQKAGRVVAISEQGAHIGVTFGEKTPRVIPLTQNIEYQIQQKPATNTFTKDWKREIAARKAQSKLRDQVSVAPEQLVFALE